MGFPWRYLGQADEFCEDSENINEPVARGIFPVSAGGSEDHGSIVTIKQEAGKLQGVVSHTHNCHMMQSWKKSSQKFNRYLVL